MERVQTEKVCVNLSAAEVGKMDLLVDQGLFTNRSDVIRSGIRRVCEDHNERITEAVRRSTSMGFIVLDRGTLLRAIDQGEQLNFSCIGILVISPNVTVELALRALNELRILGALKGNRKVIDALEKAGRIRRGGI